MSRSWAAYNKKEIEEKLSKGFSIRKSAKDLGYNYMNLRAWISRNWDSIKYCKDCYCKDIKVELVEKNKRK